MESSKIKEIYKNIVLDKAYNLQKSSDEFTNAMLVKHGIDPNPNSKKFEKKFPKFLNFYQIQKILIAIPQFKDTYHHLFDKKGNLNYREFGENKKEIILLFNKNTDIKKICKDAKKSFSNNRKQIPNGIIYVFEPFEGNPLNSNTNYSKIKVKNPDPTANEDYYSSFGDVYSLERRKGVDFVTFKSLKPILPVVEDHAKWRKNKQSWFFLYPEEINKASPQFCILKKKNYKQNKEHEELLKYLKIKFPKKEVHIKRKSENTKIVDSIPNATILTSVENAATSQIISNPEKKIISSQNETKSVSTEKKEIISKNISKKEKEKDKSVSKITPTENKTSKIIDKPIKEDNKNTKEEWINISDLSSSGEPYLITQKINKIIQEDLASIINKSAAKKVLDTITKIDTDNLAISIPQNFFKSFVEVINKNKNLKIKAEIITNKSLIKAIEKQVKVTIDEDE